MEQTRKKKKKLKKTHGFKSKLDKFVDEKIYFKLLNTVFLSFTLLGEWEGSQVFVLPCHLTPPTLHTTVGVDTCSYRVAGAGSVSPALVFFWTSHSLHEIAFTGKCS